MNTLDHPHPATPPSVTLRRRLDRAVAIARMVRFLGWLGRVAVVAALALLIEREAELLMRPPGFLLGRWPVITAVFLGAVAVWWRWAGRAPSRLDVARAIEADHADVGERISRAVFFLDPATDAQRESPLTRGLRELAVDEAAQAMAAFRHLPVPGLRFHAPWAVAGSVAVIAWLAAAPTVPSAGRRDGREDRRGDMSATESPQDSRAVDHTQSASRLAAVAATEAHLADVLARCFAAAPGRMVDTLPDDEQRNLVVLAEIHDESLQAMQQIRAELATHDTPAAQAAARQLGLLDDTAGGSIGVAISGNRLASAATGAARYADALMAAVRLLGGEAARGVTAMGQLPPREAVRMRRAEAALADIEQQRRDGRQVAAGREAAVASAGQQSERESRQPERDQAAGSAGAESGGQVTPVAPSDPRFAAGDAAIARPVAAAERPQARVWRLLPEAVRPFASSGGEADVPPDYRAAVDRYYQLVLDQLVLEQLLSKQVESP
jgi:hypothetical protein